MNKDLEQLIIEFCYKVVSADQESKRDEKKPVMVPTPQYYDDSNCITVNGDYTGVIVDCKTIKKGHQSMTWIDIEDSETGRQIGKCLVHKDEANFPNKKCLEALDLIEATDELPTDELQEFVDRHSDEIIGKTVEYTKTEDGKYIKNILGVVY